MRSPAASHSQVSHPSLSSPRRRALDEANENDDDDDDDDEEEEESSEDEDEDEEEGEDAGPSSSVPGQPELSRAERRELKKKQAAEQAAKAVEDGDDELLVNPNRLTKKLNISDLSAPRELTRRERCVPSPGERSHASNIYVIRF